MVFESWFTLGPPKIIYIFMQRRCFEISITFELILDDLKYGRWRNRIAKKL